MIHIRPKGVTESASPTPWKAYKCACDFRILTEIHYHAILTVVVTIGMEGV
jgi:hypothetical protein